MKPAWPIQLGGAVAVAILAWLVVFGVNYQSFAVAVPLQIMGLVDDLAVAEQLTIVQATVRVKAINAKKVKVPGAISAVLDCSSLLGVGSYHLAPKIESKLEDAWVIDFHPKDILVSLVPKVTGTVELVPDVVGYPASGYSLGEIRIAPSTVEMLGPNTLVGANSVAYVPVVVSGQRTSLSTIGAPQVKDQLGSPIVNVSFNPPQVAISVEIKKGDSYKTVGLEPAFVNELAGGYWISLIEFEPPALTLRGDAKRLADISILSTTPIDLAGHSGDFRDKVAVDVPMGVELVGTNLVDVKIIVRTASSNRKLVLLPTYTNITEGLSVTSISPPTVTVILAGAPAQLSQLNRANTSLDLDLRGSLSGVNVVELASSMFRVPEGIEVVSFEPLTLSVTLTKAES
ncbi:hypothetical protein A2V68_02780 [candidate division Kazan bacterium RBG_13_50_9]|uniref:YbbR-like protein n=1 Tax=candidate division Kazan bacterium RBG_13_50_9 TaxID=1798535 RepID=A0A1F4NUI4_UNCK3|nr:MAG: hypothetical protein A2V68_02780 [candidate division Kazan bacterium RBG_13_50_9]